MKRSNRATSFHFYPDSGLLRFSDSKYPDVYIPPSQTITAESSGTQPGYQHTPTQQIATQQPATSGPADSQWDGQYYVSNHNPAYIWSGSDWIPRPSAAQESTAQQPTASVPADSQWDGQYYVSSQNPAYVWSADGWIRRP
jgi:hypothetical protein